MTSAAAVPTVLPLHLPPLPTPWQRQRMLIAVSGGCDSVALLHTLHRAGAQRLIVCHYNHQLRSRASGNDARFVAALARRLGYDHESASGNIAALARSTRQPIEVAARNARYAFFAAVARRRRCPTLLLAHHADDQVETLLLNLFRGGARAGLGGMRADTRRTIEGTPLRLLRPFLPLWRQEIEAAAQAHRWKWREDASNQTADHTRNRIRLELLPLLSDLFSRDIRGTLLRTADILRSEDDLLRTLLPESLPPQLSVPALRELPLALQRRQILQWLQERKIPRIGYREVERIRTLLPPDAPVAKINLPGGHHARRREKQIFIEAPASPLPAPIEAPAASNHRHTPRPPPD